MNKATQGQSKTRWGQARNEVRALKAVIADRLIKGESVRKIHSDLTAEGKVTVVYSKFKLHVDKEIPEQAQPQKSQSVNSENQEIVDSPSPQREETVIPHARSESETGEEEKPSTVQNASFKW